jgi:hypothetical protein
MPARGPSWAFPPPGFPSARRGTRSPEFLRP